MEAEGALLQSWAQGPESLPEISSCAFKKGVSLFLSVVFSDLKIRAGVPLFSWYFILVVALWVSWLWDLVSVSSLANVSHDSLG